MQENSLYSYAIKLKTDVIENQITHTHVHIISTAHYNCMISVIRYICILQKLYCFNVSICKLNLVL